MKLAVIVVGIVVTQGLYGMEDDAGLRQRNDGQVRRSLSQALKDKQDNANPLKVIHDAPKVPVRQIMIEEFKKDIKEDATMYVLSGVLCSMAVGLGWCCYCR